MKFLVDAQLPPSLAMTLDAIGHDAIHTLDLPRANRTADEEISRLADGDDRVVITKDRDFRQSHLITGSPRRLLLVVTGTISSARLRAAVLDHVAAITDAFESSALVELRATALVVHADRHRGRSGPPTGGGLTSPGVLPPVDRSLVSSPHGCLPRWSWEESMAR